jgi:hypothetical protein
VKGDIMKVKKYLCLAAVATISICSVVLSQGYPNIDALTRPSPESASMLLYGIKRISVDVEIRVNGAYLSKYNETISHKNFISEVTKQLKKNTNALLRPKYDADGCIWVDIQLTTKEETEFVAANISVSFAEHMPWKRKPVWFQPNDTHFHGTTWQSRATLLVHKDKLSEEILKCVRLLSDRFCVIFWGKQMYEDTQPKKPKDQ